MLYILGLLLDVCIIAILKAVTRRRRPSKGEAGFDVGPDKFSFPSGHASRSTFIACFFLYNWGVHYIFVPPLLCWVACVSISRILLRRHHLLDLIVGVLLGIAESYFIGLIYLDKDTCTDLVWWLTDEKLDGGEYHV